MEKNTRLIISLAINGRDAYEEIQKGLVATLRIATNCDYLILNEYPEGVTPHLEVPYKFKYDLIKKAAQNGYEQIFWMDSTMRLLKNPFDLLEKSESGIVAFDNIGHPAHKYCSDKAAENLRYTYKDEDEFRSVNQTWGGCFGIDTTKLIPFRLLQRIFHQIKIGSFDNSGSVRGDFVSHRHDQTVMSFLFHYYKVPLLPYGVIAAKKDVTNETHIQYGDN